MYYTRYLCGKSKEGFDDAVFNYFNELAKKNQAYFLGSQKFLFRNAGIQLENTFVFNNSKENPDHELDSRYATVRIISASQKTVDTIVKTLSKQFPALKEKKDPRASYRKY